MSFRAPSRSLLLVALASLALITACRSEILLPHPNQRPTVRFTGAPISADRNDPAFYAYRVFWSGDDPDGRVDRFEYAIDPGAEDTLWVPTPRNEETLFFTAREPDPGAGPIHTASEFHTLVLRAVDNAGARSPFVRRAFYSYTVAPTVTLLSPAPHPLLTRAIAPSVRFRWQGEDPDGQLHTRPVRYRFRLIPFDESRDLYLLSHPDSLYRREASRGFAGWDSSSTDTSFVRYTNLPVAGQYLFAVLAIDEAGAMTPFLTTTDNLVRVAVTEASGIGPRIHISSEFLDFTYASGGYSNDELRWIKVEVPYGPPVRFHWEAFPQEGSIIEGYRWAVDLVNLTDDTPRTDEQSDYRHWSRRSALTQDCELTGLAPGSHFLYVEAMDNNGFASLGIVAFTLVQMSLDRELLVVDDTRFEADRRAANGCLQRYTTPWPSSAELDTFLYARGNFPWRCTQEPPSGVLSPPGVMAGYAFDTLGTRQGHEIPSASVPLRILGRYRHVIWLVDGVASSYQELTPPFLITLMRYANAPGRASMVGAYLSGGGRLWMLGGGAGTASMTEFNDRRNDDPLGEVYTNSDGELVRGRLMHDAMHWRSGFSSSVGVLSLRRSPRADAIAAAPWTHPDVFTGGELRAPDYRRLPAEMHERSPGADPLPPTRTSDRPGAYYRASFACEYLMRSNFVTEDLDPSDEGVRIMSTLDTLLEVSGSRLIRSPAPAMTWYHGPESNRAVFTGFAPWDYRREDCIALFDFVLQDLWDLPREPIARGMAGSGPRAAMGVPARPTGRVRRE